MLCPVLSGFQTANCSDFHSFIEVNSSCQIVRRGQYSVVLIVYRNSKHCVRICFAYFKIDSFLLMLCPLVLYCLARPAVISSSSISNPSAHTSLTLYSQTEIPHAYMQCEARIDRLLGVRKQLKAEGVQASLNDYIIKAAALCLRLHPAVNCVWSGDQVRGLLLRRGSVRP